MDHPNWIAFYATIAISLIVGAISNYRERRIERIRAELYMTILDEWNESTWHSEPCAQKDSVDWQKEGF